MHFIKKYLYDTSIDFVRMRYVAGAISAAAVLLSWALFVGVGPNWGIDFTGGTEIHLNFQEDISIDEIRGALRDLGLSDDNVQEVSGRFDHEFMIRIQDATFGAEEAKAEVVEKLVQSFGDEWINGDPVFDAQVGARLVVNYNGPPVTPQRVQEAIDELVGASVNSGKDENQVIIKLAGLAQQIEKKISSALGDREFKVLSTDSVGPKVGGELRRQGFISVAATLGLVLLYVAFRFDIGFAPGAIVALIHDVSIVVGIFTVMQLEFNLPMIGALLTIVGYSLNDTIVIYDRIRENRDRYRRQDTIALINVSINETLARTVATSITTFLAMMMFLAIGGPVIRNFALAMLLGIVFGTYSTVFVASPMVLIMEDLKPWLSRLVAAPVAEEPLDEEAQEEVLAAMSESEKRRHERASKGSDPAPGT